uniref:Uncharacterized protein n=1 Tax=Aegilops tauschii TaxID=37682 RepID=M8AMG3_AEGTA
MQRDIVQRFKLPSVREGFFTFSAASVKKLKDIVQRFKLPSVREGFFTFSAASVKKLKPVGVRSGSGDKMNGKVTVFEGPEREGSMSLEVCLAPEALERLVADHEFMDTVSVPVPPA